MTSIGIHALLKLFFGTTFWYCRRQKDQKASEGIEEAPESRPITHFEASGSAASYHIPSSTQLLPSSLYPGYYAWVDNFDLKLLYQELILDDVRKLPN